MPSRQETPVSESSSQDRFWKLDALRGGLIIGMVVFHLLFDLHEYQGLRLGALLDWWGLIRVLGASGFLLIVGIGLSLSHRKKGPEFARYALWRSVELLMFGVLITIVTLWFEPDNYVTFGVLSLIGASTLLSFVSVHKPLLSLIGGIILLVEGSLLYLSPTLPTVLGWIAPSPFLQTSLDYYPLLPWMGLVFIGIYLGHRFYKTTDATGKTEAPALFKPMNWCGRKALWIYLLHQPVIILLLRLLQLT